MSEELEIAIEGAGLEEALCHAYDMASGVNAISINSESESQSIMLKAAMKAIYEDSTTLVEPTMEGLKDFFKMIIDGIKYIMRQIEKLYKRFIKFIKGTSKSSIDKVDKINTQVNMLDDNKVKEAGIFKPKAKIYVMADRVKMITANEFIGLVDNIIDTNILVKEVVSGVSIINSDVGRYMSEITYDGHTANITVEATDFMGMAKTDLCQSVYKAVRNSRGWDKHYNINNTTVLSLPSINGKGILMETGMVNTALVAQVMDVSQLDAKHYDSAQQIDLSEWKLSPLDTVDKEFLMDIEEGAGDIATRFKRSAGRLIDNLENLSDQISEGESRDIVIQLRQSITAYGKVNANIHMFGLKAYQHISQSINRYLTTYKEITDYALSV